MDKGKPLKLFPIPRLSSSQVSAVKPQSVTENSSFFQNLKAPLGFAATQNSIHHDTDYLSQKRIHVPEPEKEIYKSSLGILGTQTYANTISECFSNKVSHLPTIEEENTKPAIQLYSVLYKEVGKIKKWKIKIDYEINQKEKKLQDYTKTVDAQHKIIQKLQLENEKLNIKLEDEINENKALINQSNSTRHVFDLLKDTCTRASDKASMYENEREETRQMYGDLNNNLERMIMAFEELRIQAENSRQETYIQLKQEAEKKQKLANEYSLEISRVEHQISQLTHEKEDCENTMLNLRLQLTESTNKICVLEEKSKSHGCELEQSQNKTKELTQQLEETNICLKNIEDVNKCTTIELQNTKESLLQAAKEKETLMEELKTIKEQHILKINILETANDTLKEQLRTEQTRLKEREESLEKNTLVIHNKSNELDAITKQKDKIQSELDGLKCDLDSSHKANLELEQQITKQKSENKILLEKIQDLNTFQEKLQNSIKDLKIQISNSFEDDKKYSKEITELKAELDQKELTHRDLLSDYERLLTEKGEMAKSADQTTRDLMNLQKELEARKKNEENAHKEIETLKENNGHLRKEAESFQEILKINNEEAGEISKKGKQLKTLENKLAILKKQVEKKNKLFEDIQQENKSLKQKITEENKQCRKLESEVKELKDEFENARLEYEKFASDKQKEIEDYKLRDQHLCEQTEKLKLSTGEATRLQKESDIRCQHKIAEIVALMEKHKNQYDKMVEDKDAELDRYIAREQELTSKKTFLETALSSTKEEIILLKKQLKKTTEEKEEISRQAEENKANFSKEKKNKLIQVTVKTPVQTTKKIDPHNSASFSNKREQKVPLSVSRVEVGKTLGEKCFSPWNSPGCTMYTPRKTYAVKTPPKHERLQHEQIKSTQQELAKKKRKVALDFDFHSDSSEPTDILGFCDNEETFKQLAQKIQPYHFDSTVKPKKTLTGKVLKSPGSALKSETMKKMREAGWSSISKIERRRKMKFS